MNGSNQKFSGRVLIVDDDPIIRMLACETLTQSGFEVRDVANGVDAISVFDVFVPDIVLLDVLMPGMDGFQTCQALRSRTGGADVPIVIMTGLDDLESITTAYQSGATDFLTKPMQFLVLPYRVQYIIRSSMAYTDRKLAEMALKKSEERFRSFVEYANDIVFSLSNEGVFTYVSPNWKDVTGYDLGETIGKPFIRFVHPDDADSCSAFLRKVLETREKQNDVEYRILHKDDTLSWYSASGSYLLDAENQEVSFLGIGRDISKRKQAEKQIHHLAYHDSLTGLPNRRLFNDRMNQAIQHAQRIKEKIAVLYIDLDDFKLINDNHGHRVGDLVLVEVSRRLKHETRAGDTLTRLGGDEFTILLQNVKSAETALFVARKHLSNLLGVYQIADKELFVSASIGVALFPEHGDCAEMLLKSADAAMYLAKQAGKNQVELYTQTQLFHVSEKLSLKGELRRALENKEFVLHYQPRINLHDGTWNVVEALVRWQHPDRGLIPPFVFIPLAEETGLIMELGEWVLREATLQLHRWHLAGFHMARVSVNVSPLQFRRQNIVGLVKSALSEASLCTRALELEITESALMENFDRSISTLQQLQHLGISISIDDFGTGYSSLSYLRSLPVDILKVDRSFVMNAHESDEDAKILSAIIALAHSLKLDVVAEGVEHEEQDTLLDALSCREAQGFYYAYPMPPEELATLMLEQTLPFQEANPRFKGAKQENGSQLDESSAADGEMVCLRKPGRPLACHGKRPCESTVLPV